MSNLFIIQLKLSLNIKVMEQTRKVSTNIFLEPAKFFFMALHICQRQFLSIFFHKKVEYQKMIILDFTNKIRYPNKISFY